MKNNVNALSKIIIFATILKLLFLRKKLPPKPVKNKAGKVLKAKKNMPKAANNGLVIEPAIAKAPYNRPHGIKPNIIPSK